MSTISPSVNQPLDISLGLSSKGAPQNNKVIWKSDNGITHQIDYKTRSTVGWANKLLALTARLQGVTVKISDKEIAVFKREDLHNIRVAKTLDQSAQKVVELIKKARASVMEGLGSTPTNTGTSKTSEPSPALPEDVKAKMGFYKNLIMKANFGPKVSDNEKESVANDVAELATTKLSAYMEALSGKEGKKLRTTPNRRDDIDKSMDAGRMEEAEEISKEGRITKVWVNKEGQTIVSVELPLGEGVTATVRTKMELNLSTNSVRVVAYSRVQKIYGRNSSLSNEWSDRQADIEYEVEIFQKLEAAGAIDPLFTLTPVFDKQGKIKGYEAPIAQGTGETYTREGLPPNSKRYTGESLRKNVTVARDLMNFLSKLHALGMVHQDVKPDNILIYPREDGSVTGIVSDFATVSNQGEKRKQGTGIYLSPECRSNTQLRADTRTDCYAAGVSLKQLVYGINAKVDQSQILQDLEGDPIDDVIRGLCDQNPETRWTAEQAQKKLDTILFNIDFNHAQALARALPISIGLHRN